MAGSMILILAGRGVDCGPIMARITSGTLREGRGRRVRSFTSNSVLSHWLGDGVCPASGLLSTGLNGKNNTRVSVASSGRRYPILLFQGTHLGDLRSWRCILLYSCSFFASRFSASPGVSGSNGSCGLSQFGLFAVLIKPFNLELSCWDCRRLVTDECVSGASWERPVRTLLRAF